MFNTRFAKQIVLTLGIILISCGTILAKPQQIIYELSCSAKPNLRFNDLPVGLVISTSCDINNSQIYDNSQLTEKQRKAIAKKLTFAFKPEIAYFFEESFKKYASQSGFSIAYDRNNNFTLRARLKEFKLTDGIGSAPATVVIEWSLIGPEYTTILSGEAKGRHTLTPGQIIPDVLDKAYGNALEDIDWQGIAYQLNKTKKIDEKEKVVTGSGDTELEQTVIRWYILSNPLGADVSWRVVSSTPDVKNTNSKFVGTTPYETTESFDIKGMKYNNAGNIQIEVTCEKNGYITQTKRFNLRQAIDQKEISAKFNLIKEKDE